jgi:putative SOS response-associated peptidase YedK
MLTAAGCRIWLGGTAEQGRELLQPYADDLLVAWPVSRRVNSPSNNDEKLIQPEEIA